MDSLETGKVCCSSLGDTYSKHTHTLIHLLSKTQGTNKCQTFFLRLYKLQLSGTVEHCHSLKYVGEGM